VYEEAPEFGKEQEIIWLPKSQVEPLNYGVEDLAPDSWEQLIIPIWLTEEKGLV